MIRVRNWREFQHYKERSPPWIKVHNSLIENYEFGGLTDVQKCHLILIWLLASRTDNKLHDDPEWVRKRIGASNKVDLQALVNAGFLERYGDESEVLAECVQDASNVRALAEESRDREEESRGERDTAALALFLKVTGRKFTTLPDSAAARWKEGATLDDLERVLKWLWADRAGTDLEKFIRPSTVFSKSKWSEYVVEATRNPARQEPEPKKPEKEAPRPPRKPDHPEDWAKVLAAAEARLNTSVFKTYWKPLHGFWKGEDGLLLLAPNKFITDWIIDNYLESIEAAYHDVHGREATIKVVPPGGIR